MYVIGWVIRVVSITTVLQWKLRLLWQLLSVNRPGFIHACGTNNVIWMLCLWVGLHPHPGSKGLFLFFCFFCQHQWHSKRQIIISWPHARLTSPLWIILLWKAARYSHSGATGARCSPPWSEKSSRKSGGSHLKWRVSTEIDECPLRMMSR